ncbi:MAG TPA: MFS transporter [Acidimicrobiales bacterium]|nr:MFS transporter [Acidimicrobiales bacterium]
MPLASLRPLRSRNFALLWSSALVSNVGTWMQTVALGVLVYARSGHQAGWTGLVAAAAFLPMGLLAPVGGALADRFDRRRWLLLTTLGEMAVATLLTVLVATGHDQPGLVVIVAFFGGAAGAVGFPAYQAMLPDLVPKEDLLGAISLSSAQFNLGRVVGPAVAGLTLLHHDYTLTFAVNAASFGAVVIALSLLRLPRPVRTSGNEGMYRRIADGARTAMGEPGCRSAIILIAVVALLASPFIALVPVMSKALGHGSGGTALLVTAQGVGAVIGAMVLPSLAEQLGRRRMVRGALFLLPLLLINYGLSPTLWWSLVTFVLVGAGYIAVLAGLNTVVQLRAPAASRGRVLGFYMMALGIIYPVGAVLQGLIADHVGVRAVTVGGAAALLVVLGLLATFRPHLMGALDDIQETEELIPTEELP